MRPRRPRRRRQPSYESRWCTGNGGTQADVPNTVRRHITHERRPTGGRRTGDGRAGRDSFCSPRRSPFEARLAHRHRVWCHTRTRLRAACVLLTRDRRRRLRAGCAVRARRSPPASARLLAARRRVRPPPPPLQARARVHVCSLASTCVVDVVQKLTRENRGYGTDVLLLPCATHASTHTYTHIFERARSGHRRARSRTSISKTSPRTLGLHGIS